jgi:hypothetical protein
MPDKTAAAVPAGDDVGLSGGPVPRSQSRRGRLSYLHDRTARNSVGKQAARRALVAIRRPTGQVRMLPSFLIVGAQRWGPTSMSRTLTEHPAVFGAVLHEEVHYFDNAYDRGLGWYRSHFPLTATARRAAGGLSPVAFESSPYYLFHPLAAHRIAQELPSVKLLVLLRDPVERAYSGHAHEVAHGFETEPFERALELEQDRLDGEEARIIADPAYFSFSHQHHSYRARGEYARQLDRMAQHFGRDRIHIVDSGADPAPVYDSVLEFLGLPHRGRPDFPHRNARPRSPMPTSIRAALEEYYRPHDERLQSWLGHEPSWRRGR